MKKRTKKMTQKTIIAILIIFIICLLFVGYTFAKGIENVVVKSNGQIAEPILLIENDPSIDITANNNEGIYNFAIKNYNEQDKITDIKLKYYIEILSNVDNSVQIDLFNNEDKIELNDNKTDYIEVSNDEKEEKQYQIKIKYEKEKSESVSEIMEKIQVKVHTEQVKA